MLFLCKYEVLKMCFFEADNERRGNSHSRRWADDAMVSGVETGNLGRMVDKILEACEAARTQISHSLPAWRQRRGDR